MFLAMILLLLSTIILVCVIIFFPQDLKKRGYTYDVDWYELQNLRIFFITLGEGLCFLSLWYFLFNLFKIFF